MVHQLTILSVGYHRGVGHWDVQKECGSIAVCWRLRLQGGEPLERHVVVGPWLEHDEQIKYT